MIKLTIFQVVFIQLSLFIFLACAKVPTIRLCGDHRCESKWKTFFQV